MQGVGVQDAQGTSALHQASLKGRFEVVEILIDAGADVNITGLGASVSVVVLM